MKSAELVLRDKFRNNFLDCEYIDLIIEAMEEYAAIKIREAVVECTIPVVSGSLPLASDEDIEREANELRIEGNKPELMEFAEEILSYVKRGFVFGAKAMRDGRITRASESNDR